MPVVMAYGAEPDWDAAPTITPPESSARHLYAIVNTRGVNIGGGFSCGVMVARGYGQSAYVDLVNSRSGLPEGSLWFFTEGETAGTVEIRNNDYPEAGLGYNPDHAIGNQGSNAPDWYLLPNGLNTDGLVISSTSPISAYSCLDASNGACGENGLWGLSGGWQPSDGDWTGTTWMFVEMEDGISTDEFVNKIRNAYFKPTGEKTVVKHTSLWDITKAEYITVSPDMYDSPTGRFSFSRMKLTDNIAYLWEPEFGDNPATAPGNLRMDMDGITAEMEKAFRYYYDTLGFIDAGFSCIDRHYLNMYIFASTSDNALYAVMGGTVPYMCIHPFWFSNSSYFGGAAHELAHTFQGAAVRDGNPGMSTTIAESCAQFMISSYYKEWPLYEPGHVTNYMNQTHLAFLNSTSHYDSPFVYEYWAEKHGRDIMGRLWRYNGSSDPVARYKEMMEMDQKAFADEMYEAVSHFPTWDLELGRASYEGFRNKHPYQVDYKGNGMYSPVAKVNPRGYGYNAAELIIPEGTDRRVTLEFNGIDTQAANNSRRDLMGWRYGFVAYQRDGLTVYSPMMDQAEGTAVWNVPEATTNLWLVVMGAPTAHYTTGDDGFCNDEFPWEARLTGTGVKGYPIEPLDEGVAAGIAGVVTDSDCGDIEYYDLTGRRVDARAAKGGVYIRRSGSKAEKVILK